MYGFGRTVRGTAKKQSSTGLRLGDYYRFWRVRFLGSEEHPVTKFFEYLVPEYPYNYHLEHDILTWEIRWLDAASVNRTAEAVSAPVKTNQTYSGRSLGLLYPSRSKGTGDFELRFEFARPMHFRSAYIDFQYINCNWLYEYSPDGISWAIAGKGYVQPIVDASQQNLRIQVTTEFYL